MNKSNHFTGQEIQKHVRYLQIAINALKAIEQGSGGTDPVGSGTSQGRGPETLMLK